MRGQVVEVSYAATSARCPNRVLMRKLLSRELKPRAVLAALIIATLLAVASTYSTFSHTYDEPAHLATGLELLDLGTYSYERGHPPLARLAIALGPYLDGLRSGRKDTPLSSSFWIRLAQSSDEGRRILYEPGPYDRVLTLARLGILPFLLVALLVTYAWARSVFGEWPAVLAVALLATVPPFLGNAGIATLDVPLAALGVASMFAFCQWLDRPRIGTALALGIATGGAVMTKFSAIPFLGLSFTVIFSWRAWINARHGSPSFFSAHVKTGIAAAATTLVVFWLCYGAGFTTLVNPANRPYESIENLLGEGSALSNSVSDALEVPIVPKFVSLLSDGIAQIRYHNRIGHRSYLLGEVGSRGWWYYYLVALGVKTPLPLLVVGLCGIGLLLRASDRERDWRVAAPALGFLSVLLFSSVYSNINLGVRHVLILYPLLAIAAAYAVMHLVHALRHKALALVAVALFVAAQAGTSLLAYPDFMTYFNAVAGSKPERVLIPIDLDWGQDLKRLEAELHKRGVDRVAVDYYGSGRLDKHDLPGYTRLVPYTPQTGWIAVSLWRLTRNRDFDWLRTFEPVARIGTSINLYHITDKDTVAKLAPIVIELAPGVLMRDVKGLHGSNQAFIEFDSYVVVFDPSTVIQARQLLAEIRTRTSKPVRYVIISHFHPDHSAGAAVFAEAGAEVVAAAAARRDFDVRARKDFAAKILQRPEDYRGLTYSPPARYIDKTWVLDDGVQRLDVTHHGQGHTSGELVGWMPKYRVMFTGDLSVDGYLDLANAGIKGRIVVLDKLRALQPRQVVPGHGRLAGPQLLENSQNNLVELQAKVNEMAARRMAFEEVVMWYRGILTRMEVKDIEVDHTEAGGIRDRSSPLVTKKRVAWLAVLAAVIVPLFVGFLSWKRRPRK